MATIRGTGWKRNGWWMAAAVLLVGCGGSPPAAKPLPSLGTVTGTITLGDEPVEGAIVTFVPNQRGEGHAATAVTDIEGNYELGTNYEGKLNPGAAAGQYRVIVSRLVALDGTPLPPDPSKPPMMQGGKESIPRPYSDPVNSPLLAKVLEGGGTFDFKLKKK